MNSLIPHMPRNARQVEGFVLMHFDLRLPRECFTPGHSTPLGFVADAFLNPGRDVAAWACRSGGKTLGASILAAMEFIFIDTLEARVLSGSENQSRNLYEYWSRWCGSYFLKQRLAGPVRRQATHVRSGRLEILAASQHEVRGPKVHRLFEDELDEIDPEIDTAAVGMITSSPGIPGRTVYTGTWHRAGGPMARLVDRCPANGVSLHKWNIWEAIHRCPPDRHQNGAGCEHCPLAGPCVGKARQRYSKEPDRRVGIAAEADGLYGIDDAIKAYSKISLADWEAEFECKRPRAQGLVYPEFDPSVHRCDEAPGALTIYRSIDWGSGVFVCLWLGADSDGRTWLLDTYRAECGTVHQHARYIGAHRIKNVVATFCDPAGVNRNDQTGQSNIEVFREYGIHCTYATSPRAREVRNGISLVRAALAPANGQPRLFYLPGDNNRIFAKAMQSYSNRRVNGVWTDQPQDPQEFEHIPDALRYYFVNRDRDRGVSVARFGAS